MLTAIDRDFNSTKVQLEHRGTSIQASKPGYSNSTKVQLEL